MMDPEVSGGIIFPHLSAEPSGKITLTRLTRPAPSGMSYLKPAMLPW